MKRSTVLIAGLLSTALVAAGVYAVVISPAPNPCVGVTGITRTFAIISTHNGFNDSASGPVMAVSRCDKVTITYINSDSQTHGLAIDTYSTKGLALQGGQSQSLTLVADKTGQFRVFCNIFCTVHPYMQNGQLNVT